MEFFHHTWTYKTISRSFDKLATLSTPLCSSSLLYLNYNNKLLIHSNGARPLVSYKKVCTTIQAVSNIA